MADDYVPIGKLFNVEKGQLQSTKCTPGEFDFITAAKDWKTHHDYNHECEALIFAAAASGSLGRTHYVDGKFISSDLCFILTPKDEDKFPLNLEFYHFVFNSLRPTLVAATKSGTSKESINQSNFKKYELPYFSIEQQNSWIEKLKSTMVRKDLLGCELTHQQTLLKKLRQQILQEAIEGKLTTDWRAENPDVEPASELLNFIDVKRKQWLEAEKKVGNNEAKVIERKLTKLKNNYSDFPDVKLQKSWQWASLLETMNLIVDCHNKTAPYESTGIKLLRTTNIRNGKVILAGCKYVTEETYEYWSKRCPPLSGDILYTREAPVGEVAIIPKGEKLCMGQRMMLLRPFHKLIDNQFILYALMAPGFLMRLEHVQKGAIVKHLRVGDVESAMIALPPTLEQKAIVTKVEKLFAICDQLETQITNNQTHAEQLMQAVLKEAFQHDSSLEEVI